ncbi:hypothetical protein RCL1_002801 [Eukaryota sp. TZLM3-RCL]
MFQPCFPLSISKRTKNLCSNFSLVQDSKGTQFLKENTASTLSTEEFSQLTSLKHPNLVGYYHSDDVEINQIVFDYCKFGLCSNLDVSKVDLSCHDLWSIRNQILHALQYLASQGLYHKSLNVSNVLVCSLHPICIKLSLFMNSHVLIGLVNTDMPIEEFWKQKMIEKEEVCFDELIRFIVKSVFPYSIIDKNIVFTNPSTLERDDLESLKALIYSIESETIFRSPLLDDRVPCVNNMLYCPFLSTSSRKENTLFFTNALLFHVFIQEITKYETPLLLFDFQKSLFQCQNEDFSKFATKVTTVSSNFRNVFIRALDLASGSSHVLSIGKCFLAPGSILNSKCTNIAYLSSPPNFYLNFLIKFPITTICTTKWNFDTGIISNDSITEVQFINFNEDLTPVTLFPNLASFCLINSKVVYDFGVLALCHNLRTVELDDCSISDLTPFSLLEQLTSFSLTLVNVTDFAPLSFLKRLTKLVVEECEFYDLSHLSSLIQLTHLSLKDNPVADLSPLQDLRKLSTLDVRETFLPKEHQRELTNSSEINALIKSFKHGVFGIHCKLLPKDVIIILSTLSHYSSLRTLYLADKDITDISEISKLTSLEILDLSNVILVHHNNSRINDISFLSSCVKLKSLSLDGSDVLDLSPLFLLSNNLKSLSLSNTGFSNLEQVVSFKQLEFLSLNRNTITDVSPLSTLFQLKSLSIRSNPVFDLWSLRNLNKLSTLDLRNTILPKEFQRELHNASDVKQLVHSFINGICGLDFSNCSQTFVVNLSMYSHCWRLKSLNLSRKVVENIFEISEFHYLEALDLSNVTLQAERYDWVTKTCYTNKSKITDISFLSSCINLTSLSLCGSEVKNLSPLANLTELSSLSLYNTTVVDLVPLESLNNLSYLDLRYTRFPPPFRGRIRDPDQIILIIHLFRVRLNNVISDRDYLDFKEEEDTETELL